MADIDLARLQNLVNGIADPHTQRTLGQAKCLRDLSADGGRVAVKLELGYPAKSWHPVLAAQIDELLGAEPGVEAVSVEIDTKVIAHSVQKTLQRLENVRNIVAVASGKGGVGKSTTSVNLALALAAEGASVGILDADIYGPSQPRMMGIDGRPESPDGESILPLVNYGVQTMSIGYLIDESQPMVWRGPMATQALEQLLRDTRWDDLDYLIIDMPPGTGDIQLTLSQKVPVSGSLIVTTPQDIALLDARKGLEMFKKVSVPVLGIVENMSTHICSNCGHEEHIFGSGGGAQMAADCDVELLGSLPLDIRIREQADGGQPTVVAEPDGAIADAYREIARNMAGRLATRARDYSGSFPKIVIQNT
jgi:ATP-binding protein involved in chromosome partitioning